MNLQLKKLNIVNFKGIKELTINFDKNTNIYGENGTGKTTIADSIFWLLFGKDSQDRADFEIQPLDMDNNVIHFLDTSIEATFDADGTPVILKRLLQEKWTKKKGEKDKVFEGTTTSYYVNDLPYKKREYDTYVYNLIDVELFKLVTNPMYFSSLNWMKRRKILMDITGDISDDEVIAGDESLQDLKALLYDGVDNFMKRTKEQIKKLKKDRDGLPPRIDELMKQVKDQGNIVALEFREKNIKGGLTSLKSKLNEINGEQYLKNLQKELENKQREHSLNLSRAVIDARKPSELLYKQIHDSKSAISDKAYEQKSYKNRVDKNTQLVAGLKREIQFCEERREEYKITFEKIAKRKLDFTGEDTLCPACKQELPQEQIEETRKELVENYEQSKKKELELIRQKGIKNNVVKEQFIKEIEVAQIRIEEESKKIENIYLDIENLKANLYDLEQEYEKKSKISSIGDLTYDGQKELLEEIKEIEYKINKYSSKNEDDIKEKISSLEDNLSIVQEEIANFRAMEGLKNRIAELKAMEEDYSQSIADLEMREFLGQQFIHKKVEMLELKINECFKQVKFKLFDIQVNGGLNECCEALINGVPFSDANTAAKINAGIDIIDTLCHYYTVNAPIFIDNRESVNKLIEIDSQIINLIVSKDKNLRVEV